MHWKKIEGQDAPEKMFALPGKKLHSRPLFDSYQNLLYKYPESGIEPKTFEAIENENIGLRCK